MSEALAFDDTHERGIGAGRDGDRRTTEAVRSAERAQPAGTLQRTMGNAQLCRILRMAEPGFAMTAAAGPAAVGAPGDRAGNAPIKRKQCHCDGVSDASDMCAECAAKQGPVQRYATQASGPSHLPPSVARAIQGGGGERLPDANRAHMELALGADLGGVRIHKDPDAAHAANDINARAFTVGQDVYFGAGQHEPGTKRGNHLLAHELTHTLQQASGNVTTQAGPPISSPADPLEREAEAVADSVSDPPSSRPALSPRLTTQPMVQGDWYDFITDTAEAAWSGAKSVGGEIAAGAEAAWSGAKWVGGQVAAGAEAAWEGAKWLGGHIADEVRRIGGAAWECAKLAGHSTGDLLQGKLPTMAELLDMPKPAGDSPVGVMDVILAVVRHPCVRIIPGYPIFAKAAGMLRDVYAFLKGAWQIVQDPDRVISAIRDGLAPMMSGVAGRSRELAGKAITFSDPPQKHLAGIWRHLEPKLEYFGTNWWDVIKETAWDLVWPWPGVGKDLGEIWEKIKAAGHDVRALEISSATDDILAIWRLANQMIGRLYGWFFIASVLIGAIVGAFFGGAGAIPGAAAGAKIALAVGEGLLISTIAAETLTIGKAGFDLVHGAQSEQKNEEDYERVANSSIVLGVTGLLYLLGALAARFARAVINRVAGRVWRLPGQRGRGPRARGDVIEIRVVTAARVRGLILRYSVDWLELIRRDFPGIDLAEDAQIGVTPRPRRAPLYEVRGGRVISVKSTAQLAGDAQSQIRQWVRELQGFSGSGNVSVVNPTSRVLMVATEAPLDAARQAAVRAYAAARGVRLELFANLPPDHPALVFPEAIPVIMAEAGESSGEEAPQPQPAAPGAAGP